MAGEQGGDWSAGWRLIRPPTVVCCSVQTDAWFEVISIVMNMAIWHTKHAALKASSDRYVPPLTLGMAGVCVWSDVHTHGATFLPFSITVEEAKEVHRSLKLAAGMFLHIKEQLLPKLPATPEKGTDFDTRVVEAYASQSQAEAQEG